MSNSKLEKKYILIAAGVGLVVGFLMNIPFLSCLLCFITWVVPGIIAFYIVYDKKIAKDKMSDGIVYGTIYSMIYAISVILMQLLLSLILTFFVSSVSLLDNNIKQAFAQTLVLTGTTFITLIFQFIGTAISSLVVGVIGGLIATQVEKK